MNISDQLEYFNLQCLFVTEHFNVPLNSIGKNGSEEKLGEIKK